jgi:hypothetical protein
MSRRLFIASVFDAGLVNEHYRDVVFDEINAFTFDAFQGAPIRLQLNLGFASRTREYFQKFLTNCHGLTFLSGSTGMLKAYHKDRGRSRMQEQDAGAGAGAGAGCRMQEQPAPAGCSCS